MSMYKIQEVFKKIANNSITINELAYLLSLRQDEEIKQLFYYADQVRKQYIGDGIFMRGIVEFSNRCAQKCHYCGISVHNKEITRYAMSNQEIVSAVGAVSKAGIQTVVLQSGEDVSLDAFWLAEIIKEIKLKFDIAITLSVGEKSFHEYKLWQESGAERYLLKIETTDPGVYAALHPDMKLENRIKCLRDLKTLGYQTGSGSLIGLPGQTNESIAKDIIFFKDLDLDMIGIGPFLAHPHTPLADTANGDPLLTLKSVALTRIVTRNTNIPATTALGSVGKDLRLDALCAGANVLMPNFTPQPYRQMYEIYPNKRCIQEAVGECAQCMQGMGKSIGRFIDLGKGDRVHGV